MNPNRRIFMKRAGLCGLGAAFYLNGCGGDSEKAAEKAEQATAALEKADPCTDLTDLSESQIQLRDTYGYVDKSDDPDMICKVCEFWTEPAAGGFCGGCTLMAGPIHPAGTCDSYEDA